MFAAPQCHFLLGLVVNKVFPWTVSGTLPYLQAVSGVDYQDCSVK
jgi:hypothetical protein